MTDKKQEIDHLRDIQFGLKGEISNLKSQIPTFLIGFLFVMVLSIYFLEGRVYHFFGNGMNFIKFGIGPFILLSLLYIYISRKKVLNKEKKLKVISGKLYQLMKLDEKDAKI